MTRNPKIEFYKIHIKAAGRNIDVTFRNLFEEIYLSLNEDYDKSQIGRVSDIQLQQVFFQHFYTKIDSIFNRDIRRKKAFYAKSNLINGTPVTPIHQSAANSNIHGLIKGGGYDTGKDLGNLTRPEDSPEGLESGSILLDDFYFLLHTPLDKSIAILALQSYTKDQIADIFLPFITRLFRYSGLTNNANHEKFMPREMQEEFKNNSVIKKFKFNNRVFLSQMDQNVIGNEEFTINIEVIPTSDHINLDNLPSWKRKIGNLIFNIPDRPIRELSSFNNKTAFLKSNDGRANPTPFDLNSDDIDLNATIFLENKVAINDLGVPNLEELQIFVEETLEDMIKPEVYPEDNAQ